jgi:hypothetical protein
MQHIWDRELDQGEGCREFSLSRILIYTFSKASNLTYHVVLDSSPPDAAAHGSRLPSSAGYI